MLRTWGGQALEARTCSQGILGPCHSNSTVAGTPAGGPKTSCPSQGTISILEPCVEFRQCYNEPLSALIPPPPALPSVPQAPIGFLWGACLVSTERGVPWRGDSGVGSVPSLTSGPFSTLRYHLPSVEKGREWKPEPSDSLYHHPDQSPSSQNCHCQGDAGEQEEGRGKGEWAGKPCLA